MLNECGATQSSDLWGLGCIVYHLLAGRSPFLSEGTGNPIAREYQTLENVKHHRPAAFPEGFPAAARALVGALLVRELHGPGSIAEAAPV